MKWFLGICALGGLVAVLSSSSCGPKRDFCPTAPEFSCLDYDGGSGGMGPDLGFCDGGTVYICGNDNHKQCVPC